MTAQLLAPLTPVAEVRPAPGAQPPATPSRAGRLSLRPADPLGWLLGPALLLLGWTLGSCAGVIDPRILPPPWRTVTTAVELVRDGRLPANLAISSWRVAQGLGFGVAAGVLVALASGLSLIGGYLFDGLVQIKRAIPTLALT